METIILIMSKFKIENINILCFKGYDLKFNKECTICRLHLNCNSIYNETENKSKLSVGICGHAYHDECIQKWLSNKNKHCPICSKDYIVVNI